MKQKIIYWKFLSKRIKKSVAKRYGDDLADTAYLKSKNEYRRLCEKADDLGKGNPMAMNAYFAYVFVAFYLASDKNIPPEVMADIMTEVLYTLKPLFSMVNINTRSGNKKWYREMKKYERWSEGKLDKYPTTWVVHFDEARHKQGSFYYFTRCPICEFCNREGIPEIMSPLCRTDKVMFELQHGKLYREHTLAAGDGECDYWIVGDKEIID